MKAFYIELRRSPLRWWLPAFLLLAMLMLFGRSTAWIGVWPQASAAAQLPFSYIGPALAAGAAWSAGRCLRIGSVDHLQATARRRWQVEAVHLAATITYGIAVLLVTAAVAAAFSIPDAGPGFLWAGYLVLAGSMLVTCAAIGHLVGRWSRPGIGPALLTGLGTFALFNLTERGPFGFMVLSGPPQLRLSAAALAARIALAACLVVLAVAVPPWRDRITSRAPATSRATSAIAAVMAVIVSIALIAAAGPLRVPRTPPSEPLCSTTTPRVCVWPENRKYLPELAAMAERLNQLPGDLITVPDTFYERGLRTSDSQVDFIITEGSWSAVPSITGAIVDATLPPACLVTGENAERKYQAIFEIVEWLNRRMYGGDPPAGVRGGPPGVDLAMIREVLQSPDADQATWVRQRLDTIKAVPCE